MSPAGIKIAQVHSVGRLSLRSSFPYEPSKHIAHLCMIEHSN